MKKIPNDSKLIQVINNLSVIFVASCFFFFFFFFAVVFFIVPTVLTHAIFSMTLTLAPMVNGKQSF